MADLKNVYISSIDLGVEGTNMLVIRAVISGAFTGKANMISVLNEIYSRLDGQQFSAGIRFNFYSVPSDFVLSPLNAYGAYTQTTYGNADGFQITTTKSTQSLKGATQVNSVQCPSGGLTYKGNRVCVIYTGGYSSQVANVMPAIIFTDSDGHIFYTTQAPNTPLTNALSYSVNMELALNASYPLPIIYWDSGKYAGNMFQSYITDAYARSYTLSGDDISDDIINEVPAGGGGGDGDDPYAGGGESTTGGGDGTFDYSGRKPGGIDDFIFPTISAVDAGFITLYNPTTSQLQSLASYLWSGTYDLNTFKKLFNDPMDLFIGLSILPVHIPAGAQKEVGIGAVGTGIYMTVAGSQWVQVDCGSVTISKFSGSYLDYDPYTSVEIYLPYIGVKALKADEVIGKTLHVTYNVDILSGACIAWLDVNGAVTYTFMGQCATSVPVAAGDWTGIINGILGVVGGAVGGAVKGGVGGAIAGGVAAASSVAVSDGKISVERSGTISSAGGLLAPQKPFLVINAPRICWPAGQNNFEGYPAYITMTIGDCSGYTEVEVLHLTGINGTREEQEEIKSLLMGGVIL